MNGTIKADSAAKFKLSFAKSGDEASFDTNFNELARIGIWNIPLLGIRDNSGNSCERLLFQCGIAVVISPWEFVILRKRMVRRRSQRRVGNPRSEIAA